MGSQHRSNVKRYLILVYLIVALLAIGADALFLSELKHCYMDTKTIMFGLANESGSKDTAIQWLKEFPDESWLNASAKSMAAYGYDEKALTVWDKKYQSARHNVLIFSAAFELLWTFSFFWLYFLLKKRESQRTVELEKILCRIQDSNPGSSNQISSNPPNNTRIPACTQLSSPFFSDPPSGACVPEDTPVSSPLFPNPLSGTRVPEDTPVPSPFFSDPPSGACVPEDTPISSPVFSNLSNNMRISDDMQVCTWIDDAEIDDILKDRLYSLQKQIQSERNRILREKEATKSLVTDISHQLKTPVAALKTSLELLATEEMSQKEQMEFLKNCLCQIDGLENLTKALINVSRMEKGLIQITVEPLRINDTLRAAVSRVYEKALDKRISIELEEAEEFLALHDKKWTAEVFINILDNAIKYSGKNTHVTIRVSSLIHFIKIEIEDEGIGIPKSEYHKIFQRFYRGEAAKNIEGSGVGLYLSRSIIEKQNGTIYVHSKSGANTGSIFSIQLPKA